jgi:hypothetical protein
MKRLTLWLIVMTTIWAAAVAQAGDITVKAIVTSSPGEGPVTAFPPDTPKVFTTFKSKGAKKGDKIRAVWIAEDVGDAAAPNSKVLETTGDLDSDTDTGMFSVSQPKNGWPPGKYRLEIYANDKLAATVNYSIEAMEKAEKRAAAEKAAGGPPDLSGKWIGYYEDGSKSEYVWSIQQTGSTLAISNVGGETAKSKGWVEGEKVVAEDFPTTHGKLSDDNTRITWTDGVVWKKP